MSHHIGRGERVRHGIFRIEAAERGAWACDFDDCVLDGAFVVEDHYENADEPEMCDIDQRGACWMHAQKWAGDCAGCQGKILKAVGGDGS